MLVPLFVLLSLVLPFCAAGASTVTCKDPLQDQYPPIAHVGQLLSWTFAPGTFQHSAFQPLIYNTSQLPGWLAFDHTSRTFHGTPTSSDTGSHSVEVSALGPYSSDTASSRVEFLVVDTPQPTLLHTVQEQFHLPNPSLSSVFALSPKSAFKDIYPALRIPPGWSFSVGFRYDTFETLSGDIYYGARQADGSPLPDWIDFNPKDITFDGYTPRIHNSTTPPTISVALFASDQEGYQDASLFFDLVVAEHELSLATSSLPTINITANSPFSVSLTSPADFIGVLLDGKQIEPSQIITLEIDTSYYGNWLDYDTASRTLSGTPPEDLAKGHHETLLPVTLATTVNQTIETNVSLAVVPSYFSSANLQPILVNPGQTVHFNLVQFYSNATGIDGQRDDVNLTASFGPDNAARFLSFDPTTGILSGPIPSNFTTGDSSNSHITVTFTAYSRITHSTSHTTLPISLSAADFAHEKHKSSPGLSASARAKLLLGLKIAFGIIGGMVLCGLVLAGFRKFARVRDTALEGEEGTRAWTDDEKKWYGIGIDVDGEVIKGPITLSSPNLDGVVPNLADYGYNWSAIAVRDLASPPNQLDGSNGPDKMAALGVGRPVTYLSPHGSSNAQSPTVMRKAEFLGKIRRKVSDTCKRVLQGSIRGRGSPASTSVSSPGAPRGKPTISKPTLIMTSNERARANMQQGLGTVSSSVADPMVLGGSTFDDIDFSQYEPSGMTGTSIAGSPSSSTGGRSIPRRRPDFAPPKKGNTSAVPDLPNLPKAHLGDDARSGRTKRTSTSSLRRSIDSTDSNGSSAQTHAAEAVVQRAARAMSVRSIHSASGISLQSSSNQTHGQAPSTNGETTTQPRPRLVPFTSANRVPVPKLPSSSYFNAPGGSGGGANGVTTGGNGDERGDASTRTGRTKRVVSQVAKVFRSASTERGAGYSRNQQAAGDELSEGIQYVKALGADPGTFSHRSTPYLDFDKLTLYLSSWNLLGNSPSASFSLETSPQAQTRTDGRSPRISNIPRMLARVGSRFKFRIPVVPSSDDLHQRLHLQSAALEIKLMSGKSLPRFVNVNVEAATSDVRGSSPRVVEFSGVPTGSDVGELNVGVFVQGSDLCVGRVIIEVVERS
ncbi:hypothetical protein NLI96_g3689 [Meripilus lineatus]|uniref:Dystroglycan-type cadherin-like domain-containing protein n=1 Tax=Meripilus lineatus TaxID=2056292 RepID=A0AAD5VBR1_9APHY|nr:hypothetical protein NLI96_g3689 [Physisporinus lineatus]